MGVGVSANCIVYTLERTSEMGEPGAVIQTNTSSLFKPLPAPTQMDSTVAILRATSTFFSPQGGKISHPLRSQGGVMSFTASSSEFEE